MFRSGGIDNLIILIIVFENQSNLHLIFLNIMSNNVETLQASVHLHSDHISLHLCLKH